MWSVSDDALLAGLATGDSEAAAAFVRRFQRRVYGLALSIAGDPVLAEDIAQEAFLRAWRHAGAYDSRRGTVTTWLLAITRNLSIDAIRLRRPIVIDPESILAMNLPSQTRSPEDAATTSHDVSRLRGALTELPPEQRRALLLAAFHGQTAREVSESEGIPLGTAKTRIRTAMLRLRAALVSEGQAE
ncbi:MAG TPA: sigma-70 family RNA polymerase sigma factor [Acidimicrobiia bacterium]